jgi:hypothetical protein
MGVVALVVNEIDPGIGLILGLGIAFDVINSDFLGNNGLFARLQSNAFNSPSVTPQFETVPPAARTSPALPPQGVIAPAKPTPAPSIGSTILHNLGL